MLLLTPSEPLTPSSSPRGWSVMWGSALTQQVLLRRKKVHWPALVSLESVGAEADPFDRWRSATLKMTLMQTRPLTVAVVVDPEEWVHWP